MLSPLHTRSARRTTLLVAFAASLFAGACIADDSAPKQQGAAATSPPPDSFRVRFETSRGPFVIGVTRAWAPRGADRFYELVEAGFFNDVRFFRVVPGFVAQFGINDKPKVNELWDAKRIADDSVKESNLRGTIAYASEGPNTRSHQVFINLADNARLDALGFAPFGRVVEGMAVVDSLFNGYGERPDQLYIQTLGNAYLTRSFPKLDYVKTAKVVP